MVRSAIAQGRKRGNPSFPVAPSAITPTGSVEGSQDETNGAYVAGWAWDSRYPDAPVSVEIYDGDTLLATVVAELFRKDLREAGKGNGRHGFLYPLAEHLRDRRSHQITVRVAGTAVQLRDPTTGTAARPVTRRDGPAPQPIPHISLPPYARWLYYTFLKAVLGLSPRPTWRAPAVLLASIRMFTDAQGRRLDTAFLSALDLPTTPRARWWAHWTRCYLRQADLLLALQSAHWTQAWVGRQIPCDGHVPPDGAILIAPHHALHSLGTIALRGMVDRLGTISGAPPDLEHVPDMDPTLLLHWRRLAIARERVLPYQVISPQEAGRTGLNLLREGGYLVVLADVGMPYSSPPSLIGRAWPIPRGPAWFARQSGKPVVPFMVVPHRFGWRLWLGEPVAPTQEGVRDGIEACLRQSPLSWQRSVAMAWLEAQRCDDMNCADGGEEDVARAELI